MTGSMVPAAIVARWTGRCVRTIHRWIDDRIVCGEYVRGPRHKKGRWYVTRENATDLRDGRMPDREAVAAWYARHATPRPRPASRVGAVRKPA